MSPSVDMSLKGPLALDFKRICTMVALLRSRRPYLMIEKVFRIRIFLYDTINFQCFITPPHKPGFGLVFLVGIKISKKALRLIFFARLLKLSKFLLL